MAWGRGLLTLKHPGRPDLPPVAVEAWADAGAWPLRSPESIRSQLALEAVDSRDVTRADGTTIAVPDVGPIEVRFGNRVGCTGALVMDDRVILGAIALADMDLVIHPMTGTVEVNPESPGFGTAWGRARRAGSVPGPSCSGDHGRAERGTGTGVVAGWQA